MRFSMFLIAAGALRLFFGCLLFGCLLLGAAPATQAASPAADKLAGLWLTEKQDAVVELYPCQGEVCGRFYWFKLEDGSNGLDSRNSDPSKRLRPLCHMQFMGGFTENESGEYENGWVYNPKDGATYNASMELLSPDKLSLHGYLILPFMGESQTWTRAGDPPPACTTGKP